MQWWVCDPEGSHDPALHTMMSEGAKICFFAKFETNLRIESSHYSSLKIMRLDWRRRLFWKNCDFRRGLKDRISNGKTRAYQLQNIQSSTSRILSELITIYRVESIAIFFEIQQTISSHYYSGGWNEVRPAIKSKRRGVLLKGVVLQPVIVSRIRLEGLSSSRVKTKRGPVWFLPVRNTLYGLFTNNEEVKEAV